MTQWCGLLRQVVVVLVLAQSGIGLGAPAARAGATLPVAIPIGHDADIRFLEADGESLEGDRAVARMAGADLTLWLAGNQFFAMSRVIGDFQALHPRVSVGLITLPPGMILDAIRAGGWRYGAAVMAMTPDIYGTVSVAQLRDTGHVSSYMVYMHNALELMVARGNPRHVADLNDLIRADLRVMLPNPLTRAS